MISPWFFRCSTVLLAVTFVALFSPCAKSDEGRWKLIGKSETETRWYIDAETMTYPAENLVSVWVKSVPDNIRSEGAEDGERTGEILKRIQERYFGDYGYTEALWEIDCSGAMFRLLYFRAYATDNETLFSTLTPAAEWSFIIPGSVGETVSEAACGLRQ